ncbi:hypothetical protein LARV_00768 [Longilinea arvoryzae]|uniref:Uncharacterized protein n=1 Tax=Longilinea arvoryzae TaxID=360412 RepID=A0A0S7BES7_9CHLR|nr:hypothetical protein [Longilinea arvoryzae]GAP13027.1 hypothetical protein LARV_00768 [Longilinea arvoryzae]
MTNAPAETMKSVDHFKFARWFARLAVATVFALNVSCALLFIFQPQNYTGGFEVSGVAGEAVVRGYGILFLMWNVPYLLVILQPQRHKTLFGVVLAQQAIGVLGESWMWLALPPGHAALSATGLRFIFFDGGGLIWMGAAFLGLRTANRSQ